MRGGSGGRRACVARRRRAALRARVGRWSLKSATTYEATVAAARAHLDGATFAAAWAAGEALSRDQAIAYALDDDGPAA